MRNRSLYEDLKVTTPEPKLTIPRFVVNYWDENGNYRNSDYVVAMPFMGTDGAPHLRDLILLQEELLKFAVFETAAIGSLVCNNVALDLINKIAKMLVVVDKPERGIDIKNLLNAGDYLQIGQIFLSEGYDNESITPDDYKPSRIARIHKMDFFGKLISLNKERAKIAQDDLMKTLIEPVKVPEPEPEPEPEPVRIEPQIAIPAIPAPISTPPPVAVPAKSI
jgi:hypothetical protein